jgi:hypothetical protein
MGNRVPASDLKIALPVVASIFKSSAIVTCTSIMLRLAAKTGNYIGNELPLLGGGDPLSMGSKIIRRWTFPVAMSVGLLALRSLGCSRPLVDNYPVDPEIRMWLGGALATLSVLYAIVPVGELCGAVYHGAGRVKNAVNALFDEPIKKDALRVHREPQDRFGPFLLQQVFGDPLSAGISQFSRPAGQLPDQDPPPYSEVEGIKPKKRVSSKTVVGAAFACFVFAYIGSDVNPAVLRERVTNLGERLAELCW